MSARDILMRLIDGAEDLSDAADAILADPRITVVMLPKPDADGNFLEGGSGYRVVFDPHRPHYPIRYGCRCDEKEALTVTFAREKAAAYLAAANAADKGFM